MNYIRTAWSIAWRLTVCVILLSMAILFYKLVLLLGISVLGNETPWQIAYLATCVFWLLTNFTIATVWREEILNDIEKTYHWLSTTWLGKKNEQLNSWTKSIDNTNDKPNLIMFRAQTHK